MQGLIWLHHIIYYCTPNLFCPKHIYLLSILQTHWADFYFGIFSLVFPIFVTSLIRYPCGSFPYFFQVFGEMLLSTLNTNSINLNKWIPYPSSWTLLTSFYFFINIFCLYYILYKVVISHVCFLFLHSSMKLHEVRRASLGFVLRCIHST